MPNASLDSGLPSTPGYTFRVSETVLCSSLGALVALCENQRRIWGSEHGYWSKLKAQVGISNKLVGTACLADTWIYLGGGPTYQL